MFVLIRYIYLFLFVFIIDSNVYSSFTITNPTLITSPEISITIPCIVERYGGGGIIAADLNSDDSFEYIVTAPNCITVVSSNDTILWEKKN